MTTIIRIPVLEVSGNPKKSKDQRIPGMGREHSFQSKYKRTDAEVIAIIRQSLHGKSLSYISSKEGLSEQTVRAWIEGWNRRNCYLAALDQYREDLRNGRVRER